MQSYVSGHCRRNRSRSGSPGPPPRPQFNCRGHPRGERRRRFHPAVPRSKPCHEFMESGWCALGDACCFFHPEDPARVWHEIAERLERLDMCGTMEYVEALVNAYRV